MSILRNAHVAVSNLGVEGHSTALRAQVFSQRVGARVERLREPLLGDSGRPTS